jgi:hypothetical protein
MSALPTIRCMQEPPRAAAGSAIAASRESHAALLASAELAVLSGDRLLAYQAMRLLMRLDRELLEARAQWNRDWFRRVMHVRSKAVARVQRRWVRLDPQPVIPLGSLRRRYHSNLTRYLYDPQY